MTWKASMVACDCHTRRFSLPLEAILVREGFGPRYFH